MKPPSSVFEVKIFISSSSQEEVLPLRERIKNLVAVVNQQLLNCRLTLRVITVYWEGVAAQRALTGHPNDEFIQMAVECNHTIALLVRSLRPGTEEEILAVLNTTDVELSVMIFPPGGDMTSIDDDLNQFIVDHGDDIIYQNCGSVDSDTAWLSLTGTVLFAVFRHFTNSGGAYFEER